MFFRKKKQPEAIDPVELADISDVMDQVLGTEDQVVTQEPKPLIKHCITWEDEDYDGPSVTGIIKHLKEGVLFNPDEMITILYDYTEDGGPYEEIVTCEVSVLSLFYPMLEMCDEDDGAYNRDWRCTHMYLMLPAETSVDKQVEGMRYNIYKAPNEVEEEEDQPDAKPSIVSNVYGDDEEIQF